MKRKIIRSDISSVLMFSLSFFIVDQLFLLKYGINMPILRYAVFSFSSFFLLKKKKMNKSLISFLLEYWIYYLLISGLYFSLNDSSHNYLHLKFFLSNSIFLWTVPLLSIKKIELFEIKKILRYTFFFVCFSYIYSFFDIKNTLHVGGEFITDTVLASSSLLLLTFSYHNKKKINWVLFAFLLSLLLNSLFARRNQVLFFSLVIIFYIYNQYVYAKKRKRRSLYILSLLFFTLILSFFVYLNLSSFSLLVDRVGEGMSSRENIIDSFYTDFNSTPLDWSFGRGLMGEFNGGFLALDTESGLRNLIENGYLQLILNGGVFYLLLLILLSIKSIYNGLFKSRNQLCRSCAFLLIIYFIDMIGYGIPKISFKYVLVFISISICNTQFYLNATDEYLSKKIGLK